MILRLGCGTAKETLEPALPRAISTALAPWGGRWFGQLPGFLGGLLFKPVL